VYVQYPVFSTKKDTSIDIIDPHIDMDRKDLYKRKIEPFP
jgi:hypothetical protein